MSRRVIPIDWRPELAAMAPYMDDRSGVVQFRFASENCAPNHFSMLLKQIFAERTGNAKRFSIRIDHEYSTTLMPIDILDEFKVQLRRNGVQVQVAPAGGGALLSHNSAGGTIDVDVGTINNHYGVADRSHVEAEIEALRPVLREFVRKQGRFMVEFRDCPLAKQNYFWQQLWIDFLEEFVGKGMVFVHMLGPLCGQAAHRDAPQPDWVKVLPAEFATNEERQAHAYDDLIDVFINEQQSPECASGSATTHLNQNLHNISGMHDNLAAVLMAQRLRNPA